MSYKMKISKLDRATGRFKGRVHRALMKAVIAAKNERGMTQSQIAELMGVDKSAVSRILNGRGNLTLKTIGDISWVLGLRPEISFVELGEGAVQHTNHVQQEQVVAMEAAKTSSGSRVRVVTDPHGARPVTGGTTAVSAPKSHMVEAVYAQ